ncbi:MAG: ABC transporter substrate-binding protein [Oscillospiraceae bacterium]|nr:ABC transporter substrate-binding protein [Oscillospiraceae bacterium]
MKRITAIVLALMVALSIAACGGGSDIETPSQTSGGTPPDSGSPTAPAAESPSSGTPTDTPPSGGASYGGVVRIVCTAEGANPIGVPWEVFGVDTALLIPAVESLLLERTNGEIVPFLAESYEEDAENLEIRIKLRQGVKFHDGSDFNADVAIWNLERSIEHGGNISTAVIGVERRGDYELALLLDKYQNNIISGLASHANGMISKESYEENGIDWARDNPVGTGPFKLKEYVHGGSITFVKNEDYWQDGKPYLDGMEFQFIRDVMTQNVALQAAGDQSINVLDTTNGEQIQMFSQMGYRINSMPIGPISLVPNSLDSSSPLSKLEVRQAISFALNRESIVAARGFGVLQPAYQFVGEGWNAHLPDSYNLSYDLDKAKTLLAEAGYPDGFTTTLIAQPGLADKDAVVAMQSQLAQIGITAEVEFPDSGGYSAYRSNGWEGLLVQHTRSLTVIASTFNFYFGQTMKLLSQLWYPDEMEQAIENGFAKSENTEEVQQLHKMVLDNVLVIPVYYLYDTWITQPNVEGGGFAGWGSSTMFLPEEVYLAAG